MKPSSRLPIFFVYFLDQFSFAIVFPLLATLILSQNSFFMPEQMETIIRNMLFGAVSGAFPLGMFFGAPLIGHAGDSWGRKKAFSFTLSGIIVGNLLTALALLLGSYYFLIFSRLFTGFFSGNLTLCLAALSDVSPTPRLRAKNFGILTALSGLSWTLAIVTGGFLITHPSLPFLSAAAIATANLILMIFLYHETGPLPEIRQCLTLSAFRSLKVRRLFGVLFLFATGWLIAFQWFSAFSTEKFHATPSSRLFGLLSLSLCWIGGGALLNRFFINRWRLPKIPLYGLLLLTPTLCLTGKAPDYPSFILLSSITACTASLILSNLLNLISLSTFPHSQGKILGLSQSILAAAQFCAPLLGSLLLIGSFSSFYLLTGTLVFLSFLLLWSDQGPLQKHLSL